MARQDVVLFSPFTPQECADRVAEQVAQGLDFGFSGKPFKGSVSATHLRLFRHSMHRNSFRPGFYGRLSVGSYRGQTGTVIEGSVQTPTIALVFMAVWLAFVGLMALVTLTTL